MAVPETPMSAPSASFSSCHGYPCRGLSFIIIWTSSAVSLHSSPFFGGLDVLTLTRWIVPSGMRRLCQWVNPGSGSPGWRLWIHSLVFMCLRFLPGLVWSLIPAKLFCHCARLVCKALTAPAVKSCCHAQLYWPCRAVPARPGPTWARGLPCLGARFGRQKGLAPPIRPAGQPSPLQKWQRNRSVLCAPAPSDSLSGPTSTRPRSSHGSARGTAYRRLIKIAAGKGSCLC